ncbi:acyltransferase [Lapidilactobacillus gannanensis]|uniref:Acyltransferase n=1 Tax=Lapidilactobacillus gannanensis TaxID=2486002 RepID=A0ABW4BQ85_9LACO|nr:acyltransferase family protein [Lapidilactobacillus gannanensis]
MGRTKYNPNLDLIRTVAVLAVIGVHFFLNSKFYDALIDSWQMVLMTGLRTALMICVPLFMLLTGYLMRGKTWSDQYYLKVLPTVFTYLQVSVVIFLFRKYYLAEKLTLQDGLLGMLDYSLAPYAWYVEMYFGLFLLIPFLNAIWQFYDQKFQRQLITATLALLCILPTLFNSFNKLLPDFWQGLYPLAYYFAGAYLAEYQADLRELPVAWPMTAVLVINWLVNLNHSYGQIFKWADFNDYFSYQQYFLGILVFMALLRCQLPPWLIRVSHFIAQYALAIYLLSFVFDQIFYPVLKRLVPQVNQELYYFPILVISVFGATVSLAWLMTQFFSIMRRFLHKLWSH